MSLIHLHGHFGTLQCELHTAYIGEELLTEIVELSSSLFETSADLPYISTINDQESSMSLIVRDQKRKLIGFKLGYNASQDVFYSWLGGVHPLHRKLGIASALIDVQCSWCRQSNFSIIRTKSLISNTSMYSLNRKKGFFVVGNDFSGSRGPKLIFSKNLHTHHSL